MSHNRFDADFYRRFYDEPHTRVTTREEMSGRAKTVATLVKHLELPVRRILDAGCGLGWMRRALLDAFPGATYVGLEVSQHLCERHGWVNASLADYRPRGQFDLIICYDVLQYLAEDEAERAMDTLARLARGALYFDAATIEDWRDNADPAKSDGDIHLRHADWYRTRLARTFTHTGFALHVRRGVDVVQWELEKPVARD
jgi:trans-aconitate methyltransferase